MGFLGVRWYYHTRVRVPRGNRWGHCKWEDIPASRNVSILEVFLTCSEGLNRPAVAVFTVFQLSTERTEQSTLWVFSSCVDSAVEYVGLSTQHASQIGRDAPNPCRRRHGGGRRAVVQEARVGGSPSVDAALRRALLSSSATSHWRLLRSSPQSHLSLLAFWASWTRGEALWRVWKRHFWA